MARWVPILTSIGSHVVSRKKLVNELIARVKSFHIVRIDGTPAPGKTTIVNLMVNKLLKCDPTPVRLEDGISSLCKWPGRLSWKSNWRSWPPLADTSRLSPSRRDPTILLGRRAMSWPVQGRQTSVPGVHRSLYVLWLSDQGFYWLRPGEVCENADDFRRWTADIAQAGGEYHVALETCWSAARWRWS